MDCAIKAPEDPGMVSPLQSRAPSHDTATNSGAVNVIVKPWPNHHTREPFRLDTIAPLDHFPVITHLSCCSSCPIDLIAHKIDDDHMKFSNLREAGRVPNVTMFFQLFKREKKPFWQLGLFENHK